MSTRAAEHPDRLNPQAKSLDQRGTGTAAATASAEQGPAETSKVGLNISRAALLRVFVVALVLRLAFCFVAVPGLGLQTDAENFFFSSADGYTDLAVTLAERGRYAFAPDAPPTVFRGPPFPIALALAYRVLGDVQAAAQIVNSLASAASAVLALLIMRRLLPRAGWLARYAAAFLPLSIYYCASGFSDTFLTFLILLFVWGAIELLARPAWGTGLAAGAALGLAALAKSVALPFGPLLIAYSGAFRRRAVLPAAAGVTLALCLLGGWGLRTYMLTGRFVLSPPGAGFNLAVGNYMVIQGGGADENFKQAVRRATAAVERQTGRQVTPADLRTNGHFDISRDNDAAYGRVARAMLLEHPALIARKLAVNFARFWYYSSTSSRSAASAVLNFGLLALALPGLWRWRRHNPTVFGFVLVFMLAYVGLYAAVIVNSTRYALPVLLLLAPVAGQVLARSIRAARRRTAQNA